MIATDVQIASSVLSDLSVFLRNPVIKISPTDEVCDLRSELSALQEKYDKLAAEYDKLLCRYRDELNFNMRLQDICKSNGVKWR